MNIPIKNEMKIATPYLEDIEPNMNPPINIGNTIRLFANASNGEGHLLSGTRHESLPIYHR